MTVKEEQDTDQGNPLRSDPTAQARRDAAEVTVAAGRGWREHQRAEVHAEVFAATSTGEEKARMPEVHAADGVVVVNTHGEAHFDNESFLVFMKQLEKARQVVA